MIAALSDKTTLAQRRCGGKTAYHLCPCPTDVTLSSPSRHQTHHPAPRLRIIRCVCHVTAKSASIPRHRQNHDVMLTSPDQSMPKTHQNQNFCQKAVKTSFLSISLCLLCAIFAWFSTTKTPFLLHSPPPREINSVTQSLSSVCHPHYAPGVHRTGIYPNSSPKTCFSKFFSKNCL